MGPKARTAKGRGLLGDRSWLPALNAGQTRDSPHSSVDSFTPESDRDPQETQEWVESLESVVAREGSDRARYVLGRVVDAAQRLGAEPTLPLVTDYVNSIAVEDEPAYPGDLEIERRIQHILRWNAAVMVNNANHRYDDHRRSHLHVRVELDALRGRLQPLLPRQGRRPSGRSSLLPRPRGARHLLTCVSRGDASLPIRWTASGARPSGARVSRPTRTRA